MLNHLIERIENPSNYSKAPFVLILGYPGSGKGNVLKAFQKCANLIKSNMFQFLSP